MTDPSASAPPRLRERLREKLPEIVIEAGSVVLALLLALAVNQWNERQQENERAAIAHNAILAELRSNRQEIEGAHAKLQEIVEFNIGHSIIARSVMVGLVQAVREMKELLG